MKKREKRFPYLVQWFVCLLPFLFAAGCIPRTIDLQPPLANAADVEAADGEAIEEGNMIVGHFSDRRGGRTYYLIGDIFGWFRYPKSVLTTDEAVTEVVRGFVEENAKSRGLLASQRAGATYQLSGEILQLRGTAYFEAEVRAVINFRLTTLDGSVTEQIYEKTHEVYLVRDAGFFAYRPVKKALEDALTEVISDAFEEDELQELLESGGEA